MRSSYWRNVLNNSNHTMPKNNKTTITHAPRSVIEGKLLIALQDDSNKVAMLLGREDLQMVIDGLKELDTPRSMEFATDAQVLLDRAFV